MRIVSVQDCGDSDLGGCFDLAICFLGYEDRSSFLARRFGTELKSSTKIALRYAGERMILSRANNERKFSKAGFDIVDLKRGDEKKVLAELLAMSSACAASRQIRVLIDYSSMRRDLYVELFCLLCGGALAVDSVELLFSYSIGSYGGAHKPKIVDEYVALPGLEGRARQGAKKVGVFNIGFEPVSTLSLYESIEAEDCLAVVSDPGATGGSAHYCRKLNSDFLSRGATLGEVSVPLRSVQNYCSRLIERLKRLDAERDIIFAPNGPKPHVLGSIICCFQEPRWANIYVKGREWHPIDVQPQGERVITRVRFLRWNGE